MATQTFVFVLGGPGSGKGTLCQKLKEEFPGWKHLSVGQLLRQEVAKDTDKGQQWAQLMKEGKNVTTDDVLDLLEVATKESSESKFLLDGFPRALDQAEAFQARLGNPTSAIFINVPEELLKERLLARGTQSEREDDNAETIEERLKTYNESVLPCVGPLGQICKVQSTDGSRKIEEVLEDVKAMVKEIEETPTKVESEDAPLEPAKEEPSAEDAAAGLLECPEQQESTESGHPESSSVPPEQYITTVEPDTENKGLEDPINTNQIAEAPGDAVVDANEGSPDNSSSTPEQPSVIPVTDSPSNAVNGSSETSGDPQEMAVPVEEPRPETSAETGEGATFESSTDPQTENQSGLHNDPPKESSVDTHADLLKEPMNEKLDDESETNVVGSTSEDLNDAYVDNLPEPTLGAISEAPDEIPQETETVPIEETPEPASNDDLTQTEAPCKTEENPIEGDLDVPETAPKGNSEVTPSGIVEETPQFTEAGSTEDHPTDSGVEPSEKDGTTNQASCLEPPEDSARGATEKDDNAEVVPDEPVENAVPSSPVDIEAAAMDTEAKIVSDTTCDPEESTVPLTPEDQTEVVPEDTPTAVGETIAVEEDAIGAQVSPEDLSQEEAIVRIQAAERGRRARKAMKEKKKEEEAAAVLIQSAQRGHQARKEMKAKKEATEKEKAKVKEQETEIAEVALSNGKADEMDKPVEDNVGPKPAVAQSVDCGRMPNRIPVREYMDSTVVPILREGLKSLNRKRPADPLQYLADFLLDSKKNIGQNSR